MTTRAPKHKLTNFDNKIGFLNRDEAEYPSAQLVFRAVSTIIVLVRDKMCDNKDAVELSEYCFNTCGVLKTMLVGRNAVDPNGSTGIPLGDLKGVMDEIWRTLRRAVNTPGAKYNKEKVGNCKQEIQKILAVLAVPSLQLDNNVVVEGAASMTSDHPGSAATDSPTESAPSPNPNTLACQRLSARDFEPSELPSLIEMALTNEDESEMIRCLSGNDAQNFIDVMDEALETLDLPPRIRKKCLKALYKTCGRNATLPKSFQIPICYDRQGYALYTGNYADVWKGEHCGKDVAVKVIRTASYKHLERMVGRFCKEVVTWKSLRHPNVLSLLGVTMNEYQFAMVSEWMENGNIHEFLEKNPDADRIGLLVDAAKGLIYIHGQEMVHGDLKGANILIDETRHARVADFSLLTMVPDASSQVSSNSHAQGGTARWMSPELINPKRFGLNKSRPTKPSDCYAFGMVMYETISGHIPFYEDQNHPTIFMQVLDGEHPSRGDDFTDGLWEVMEQCWRPQRDARPEIEDVLLYLESILPPSEPPSVTPSVIDEEVIDFPEVPPPIGWGVYRSGSWTYLDLCAEQGCFVCGQDTRANWGHCPKCINSARGPVTPLHVETIQSYHTLPHQTVHRSWIQLQKEKSNDRTPE